MTIGRSRAAAAGLRAACYAFVAMGLAFVFAAGAIAQAPAAAGGAATPMSAEELDKLVGPIALYPDDLVAIILPAATNPLQLVQADRYLDKRKADPKLPIDEKWDDPVKSLLNYPDVVKKMSADLDWTSALGEAVVTDQGAVIEAVQAFRRKAKAAGNLKSDDKQVVKTEQEIVIIEPADPQVIYVPQYNPTTVVVQSAVPVYGYYPAPYPAYYYPYPPGAAMAAGVIWGAAIGAAWSGNRYGCCGDTNINVNRSTSVSSSSNVSRASATGQQGGTAWKSNKQPGQVSGSVGKTGSSARAGDARAGAGGAGSAGGGAARASAQPAGGGGAAGGGAARASTQPAGGGMGGASASRGGGGGGDAFGSYGSGRQAQMDSSRGASSRGASAGASARPAPSGGGARGGGGRGGGGRR